MTPVPTTGNLTSGCGAFMPEGSEHQDGHDPVYLRVLRMIEDGCYDGEITREITAVALKGGDLRPQIEADVARIVVELRRDHDHPEDTCLHARCPNTPERQRHSRKARLDMVFDGSRCGERSDFARHRRFIEKIRADERREEAQRRKAIADGEQLTLGDW
jgi:hypothetical protein